MAPKLWPRTQLRRSAPAAREVAGGQIVQAVPVGQAHLDPSTAHQQARQAAQDLLQNALEKFGFGLWSAEDLTSVALRLEHMGRNIVPGLAQRPQFGQSL